MKLKIFILIWACSGIASGQNFDFQYGPEIQGSFSLVINIRYKEKEYLATKPSLLDEPIAFNQGPDMELTSMLSAIANKDQKWWLDLWDKDSRQMFKDKELLRRVMKSYLYDLSESNVSEYARLTRWVMLGQAVLVGFRVDDPENVSTTEKEILVPFVLEDGKWKISLRLLQSPAFEAVSGT